MLNHVAGQAFHNTSRLDFPKLTDDPNNIAANLALYINSFSSRAREIIEYFGFEAEIEKLDKADRLYLVVKKFAEIDLHPDAVSNVEMGYVFEELVRKFSEAANETAGDHFTPREVIRLMVNLLFEPDAEALTKPGIVRTLYDPACGTGGMLSVAEDYLRELNPQARLECYGQEYNPESYAICGSDLMIKGQNLENIKFGDSFTADGLAGMRFDYMLANPPFGVEWKPEETLHPRRGRGLGFDGRFGAGLPRINDGSFLFLQHMISQDEARGLAPGDRLQRFAAVHRRRRLGREQHPPLDHRERLARGDRGAARPALLQHRHQHVLLDRDQPQAAGAPGQGAAHRRDGLQPEDAQEPRQQAQRAQRRAHRRDHAHLRRVRRGRALQDLRQRGLRLPQDHRGATAALNFQVSAERIERLRERRRSRSGRTRTRCWRCSRRCRARRDWSERPAFEAALKSAARAAGLKLDAPLKKAILAALSERDETAAVCLDAKGAPEPDPELRDTENVPLGEDVGEYMAREVLPYVPDAWVSEAVRDPQDGGLGKVGYEINFNRYFYMYMPPRPLDEIEADIRELETDIVHMLGEITGSSGA